MARRKSRKGRVSYFTTIAGNRYRSERRIIRQDKRLGIKLVKIQDSHSIWGPSEPRYEIHIRGFKHAVEVVFDSEDKAIQRYNLWKDRLRLWKKHLKRKPTLTGLTGMI